ncbi:fatty acid desaturase CarF family protein [Rhodoferax aquaticus]|uniref:Lipid desaturase domain-containing protein n=1 Tax=Rhodoferax aquaticus TaxID=2527691 RepID=A0A515EQF4_9BURK|nr:fatty acid desaturase CarF family protein [Rhodoferax aquaticus]QDL54876.1 hypothetical protein EXZ61_12265 [Rhodoferax aquaticus]
MGVLQRYAVRALEGMGLLLFSAMVLDALVQLHRALPLWAWSFALLAIPVAYFCADLLTGVIHWVCDSFGSERTPLWGPLLVGPFRRHHRDPLEITRISLLENLGASAIAGALVLAAWQPQPLEGALAQFATLCGVWTLVFAVVSNLFHRWAHMPSKRKPGWMLVLQTKKLLLDTPTHLRHHRKPYRVNYCILNGWANPVSNRVPWPRLEAALARLGIPTNFD